MIPLREVECAVVTQPLQMRLNAHPGVIRRAFGASIKINIELNFQPTDVLFEPSQTVLNTRFFIGPGLVLLATFFGEPD
jgi:hypothetical protein